MFARSFDRIIHDPKINPYCFQKWKCYAHWRLPTSLEIVIDGFGLRNAISERMHMLKTLFNTYNKFLVSYCFIYSFLSRGAMLTKSPMMTVWLWNGNNFEKKKDFVCSVKPKIATLEMCFTLKDCPIPIRIIFVKESEISFDRLPLQWHFQSRLNHVLCIHTLLCIFCFLIPLNQWLHGMLLCVHACMNNINISPFTDKLSSHSLVKIAKRIENLSTTFLIQN